MNEGTRTGRSCTLESISTTKSSGLALASLGTDLGVAGLKGLRVCDKVDWKDERLSGLHGSWLRGQLKNSWGTDKIGGLLEEGGGHATRRGGSRRIEEIRWMYSQ